MWPKEEEEEEGQYPMRIIGLTDNIIFIVVYQ
jgi:hypothetical protein